MIESITLQGFKSFAERTRLDFGPGVTAVIGPNGSGKSNVVEALRWACHQARARELRAAKATELIFHGSGGKAPVGLAEVQIELRTPRGQLSFSRRIYRDGSAEQDLTGRPVRVRDVQQALRGTGLGPGGLAVIGQGEVSGVVQAEGKTLLGYLQEAAGLSRAVAAREDTESRLEGARRSLSELQRLEDELSARTQRLQIEAAAAQLARTLALRELALVEALFRHRQETLRAELQAAQASAAQLEQESLVLAQRTVLAGAQLETAREAVRAVRADQAGHRQALELLEAAQHAERQLSRAVTRLQAERESLERERSVPELAAPPQAAPDVSDVETQLQTTRAELSQAESRWRSLSAELGRARLLAAQHAEAQVRSSAQRHLLQSEQTELERRLSELAPALQEAQAAREAAATERQQAETEAQQAAQRRAELEAQFSRLERQLSELRAARKPLQSEHTRLETLLHSYTRYGEGPRNALTSDHPGIIGSVADVLSVRAEYQTAASAALGRRLEQVVVQTSDDARELIDLLKRQGGRATFLPLDLLRPRPRRDSALLSESGVLGNLADLCPSAPPQISEALLADTLLLEDLPAATRLARRFQSRPRLVTLGGELLEPGGALTGGRLRDGGANLLTDQRRFGDLADELEALNIQERSLEAAHAALSAQRAALPLSVLPSLAALQAAEREAERRVTQLATELSAAQTRQRGLLGQLQQAADFPSAPADLAPADLEQRSRELEVRLADLRQTERQRSEQLAEARQIAAAWTLYRSAAEQQTALHLRLSANSAALAEQSAEQHLAASEVLRRQTQAEQRRPAGLEEAERVQTQASQNYANLLARQNKVRADLEAAQLTAARREGSLEPLTDAALLPGTPREWSAELGRVRSHLAELGLVNPLAEAEHAREAERLADLHTQREDAQAAAAELSVHLAELAQQEQAATLAAYGRVNAAFADYSRELLGGVGELEAERNADGRLCGLRLAVQPQGKRTRSLTLLSAGERTMAGLGFLFALNHAGTESASGLPLAVLDEVDAPLDEANIRRFTHFLKVFAARGAQFVLVTHQKATMEVAGAIWGVTTDASGASRVLGIKQGEAI
ncbi:chromosome segregation protein SMC [Deinococcus psychrotolerans]|uniref:Chromosome partition protein Smc n=1 Tax=Deinococcus psychrotolerans TaxID=2489213 RepID=A0A3G8YA44_9DEIO|nr:chromosome segregation SMC family protein [Deinococcus psychrotolerans]AZI41783.1 chromosome segregation protein SMC [Deinococcus psychrotolerans]